MVSFAFSEEQEAFREALEAYARKVLIQKKVIAREAYRRGRVSW
jgi:hypothetical protein